MVLVSSSLPPPQAIGTARATKGRPEAGDTTNTITITTITTTINDSHTIMY